MNSPIKPIIILLLTLVIGFGLGIFASGYFFKQRVDRFTRVARKEGFIRHHVEILEATETQRTTLRPILEKHYQALEEHRDAIRNQIDSMRKDIQPYLTDEQIEKLKERKRRKRPRKNRSCGPNPPLPLGPDSAIY
jgi:hypothetical protein